MTVDWNNVSFDYIQTNSYVQYIYKNGIWSKGELIRNTDSISIPIACKDFMILNDISNFTLNSTCS